MKKSKLLFAVTASLIAFAVWTLAVCTVDVREIGPMSTSVGFGALNGYVHALTGVNMSLYALTDFLGLVPIGTAFCFFVIGLVQLIKRKSIARVDRDLLMLGAIYAVTFATFLFFECVVINYRPVLIDGRLEASYPSSTTMLVLCVMPSSAMWLNKRIKSNALMLCTAAFCAFMVICRFICGVHWLSDIIGGALFGLAVTSAFAYLQP